SAPFSALFDTTQLLDGVHELRATATDVTGNTGEAPRINFTVNNSVQPGMIRLDDSAAPITYTGTWRRSTAASPTGPVFHWNSAMVSGTPGSTVSLTFEGTGIRWIGLPCEYECGVASISFDGGEPVTRDLHGAMYVAEAGIRSQVVYSSPNLAWGTHTLTITVLNGDSQRPMGLHGQYDVYVDAFEILK
ncbi:MAG: hypothetical protein V4603_07760, partial [Pseudomonadota bacterium]